MAVVILHAARVNGAVCFDGAYAHSAVLPDGYTHSETDGISGLSATGNHTFSNGTSGGSFDWEAVITVSPSDPGRGTLDGVGVVHNGTDRLFVLTGNISVNEEGGIDLDWSGVDSLFGPIGWSTTRTQSPCVVDLQANSLVWNTTSGGVDFSGGVQNGPLGTATTAKLFWANGPTVANIISTTPIFTQNISADFYDENATVHVPASSFPAEPPTGTTHLLLVLDSDNAVSESFKLNNVAFLAAAVKPRVTGHEAAPPIDLNLLEDNLRYAVFSFRDRVLAIPSATFRVTSAYRPLTYQQHLYEMRTKFLELWKVNGVKSYKLAEGAKGRPQLSIAPGTASMLVNDIVKDVNSEIRTHTLIPGSPHLAPAVNPPEKTLHSENPSRAVDIAIGKLSDAKKVKLAEAAGLYRPNSGDVVHFALAGTPADATTEAEVEGNSPINLLVTDSAGHKLGFDPAIGQEVNDLGPFAEYSGTNTEPQVLILPAGIIRPGGYTVTGVGTGEGGYSISLHLHHEDPEDEEPQILLATGTAQSGVALPAVQTMDLTDGLPRLFIEQLAQGSLIYWSAFATNYILQRTDALNPGNWGAVSNGADYVNLQLVLTNYSGTGGLFRLKQLP